MKNIREYTPKLNDRSSCRECWKYVREKGFELKIREATVVRFHSQCAKKFVADIYKYINDRVPGPTEYNRGYDNGYKVALHQNEKE